MFLFKMFMKILTMTSLRVDHTRFFAKKIKIINIFCKYARNFYKWATKMCGLLLKAIPCFAIVVVKKRRNTDYLMNSFYKMQKG